LKINEKCGGNSKNRNFAPLGILKELIAGSLDVKGNYGESRERAFESAYS
jgi:hypothetical protein